MPLNQQNRSLTIDTPLGSDAIVIRKLTGTEELSRPYHFILDLLSDQVDIQPEDILGKNVTVGLMLPNRTVRNFNGIVSKFSRGAVEPSGLRVYKTEMRPAFWLLNYASNCRTFQNIEKPAIIESILSGYGDLEFENALTESYHPMEFCVQYRETDFEFISRLLEEEGIFYYFKHEAGKHVLVMTDTNQAAASVDGYGTIPLSGKYDPDVEAIYEWQTSRSLLPGQVALDDFNFTLPHTELLTSSSSTTSIPLMEAFELFDYPGKYHSKAEGEAYSETRMQELEAQSQVVWGKSNAMGLTVGSQFKISGHEVASENDIAYFLSSTTHIVEQDYQPNIRVSPFTYTCMFGAIPLEIAYHPPRQNRKPIIHGPQTALVVGPTGEEIHTDKYGRVKVQFHWDRYGSLNEDSSCWVRVSQIWAGKNWGGFYFPRVGQEVVIEFLEGDPDRPIITGSVYNAEQMPPYPLPDDKTRSGVKSRSSKGGQSTESNEIRFEDLKGNEEIYIHAQKDMNLVVEHDKNETVGNDTVFEGGANRTTTIAGDDMLAVGNNLKISANELSSSINSNRVVNVEGDDSLVVHKNLIISANALTSSINRNRAVNIAADDSLTVGKTLTIRAGEKIIISAGTSSITLTRTGIVIKGNTVDIPRPKTQSIWERIFGLGRK